MREKEAREFVKQAKDSHTASLVKDGFEIGCLPSLFINKEIVKCHNNLEKGDQLL